LGRILLLVSAIALLLASPADAQPAVPDRVWLMDGRVAVQVFECEGLMCGRIVWLVRPRDAQGDLDRDGKNPLPSLRQRKLCGLTILWGLRPTGSGNWVDGWFYNPEDGKSYRVKANLKSDDVLVARIYAGLPIFGKTKTLARAPHGVSEGWC
jgi:uncharacterized protein (DUF2147 family)